MPKAVRIKKCRSVRSIVIAAASTGIEKRSKKAVMKTAQTRRGK